MYQDLSTHYYWQVEYAINDSPIRLKGNSKHTCSNFFDSSGNPGCKKERWTVKHDNISCKALSTSIRFDLKTQFFLYEYGFRPHVSDENDQWQRNFSKTLRSHYQLQSTPRNIRNLFKMADGRFPFLSFLLGLISNLVACFQANLALLIIQADYSRRRQNIVGLLSLPVSRGICVKHAQSGKLSFSNRFMLYVWTGENDAKTLRIRADRA